MVYEMYPGVDEQYRFPPEVRLAIAESPEIVRITGIPGYVQLDSFPGTTDDEKLNAALVYVSEQPRRPSIMLPGRDLYFNVPQKYFSGLRIIGPSIGWQNPEISGSNASFVPSVVYLGPDIGIEENSWMSGIGTTYDVTFKSITFRGTGVQQVFHHDFDTAGTCYAGRFDSLTFWGVKHALGSPAKPFSTTLSHFTGEWTNVGVTDVQYSLRGSDNWLWTSGVLNYGWNGTTGGKYLMRLSNMSKSFMANLYLTARNGQRALLIEGTASNQGSLIISNSVFEGQNLNDPAMGALIKQTGGFATIRDSSINFYMADPTQYTDAKDKAAVEVSGGNLLIDGCYSARATATSSLVPVAAVYKNGKLRVRNWLGVKGSSVSEWANKPIVRQAFSGMASVDDSVTLVLPDYLRRNTGAGPASATVTKVNSAAAGTAWDDVYFASGSNIRFTLSGTETLFALAGSTDRAYLAWTDLEGATKKAAIRCSFMFTAFPSSTQPIWQFRSPTNTLSYFSLIIDNNGRLGYANDTIAGATTVPPGSQLAVNTWYTLVAEIDAGTTNSNGTLTATILTSAGMPFSGISLSNIDLAGDNPDVVYGSARFGKLGNFGTTPDFRMRDLAFQVNSNAGIPAA